MVKGFGLGAELRSVFVAILYIEQPRSLDPREKDTERVRNNGGISG